RGMQAGVLSAAVVWVIATGVTAQPSQTASPAADKGASISGTVVDSETGKPLANFKVFPGMTFMFPDGPLRWDRDNQFARFEGKFTFRFSEPEAARDFGLAIEAPGYLPAASPRYTNAGNYTHHFRLKKGHGIRGVAEGPDGKPIAGAQL